MGEGIGEGKRERKEGGRGLLWWTNFVTFYFVTFYFVFFFFSFLCSAFLFLSFFLLLYSF